MNLFKKMQVLKRTGQLVAFDSEKILNAITKAFLSSLETNNIQEASLKIVQDVISKIGSNISVEEIQDQVEQSLMEHKFFKTAKRYILYRNERSKIRPQMPDSSISKIFSESSKYFDNDTMREFVFFRTYARWRPADGRRETWIETVDRYIDFMRENLKGQLREDEYFEVRESILKNETMPSMRLLQFSGDAARRCNVCVYNCAYTAPETFKDLVDIMYISMCGTGVGFSVETVHVDKFPVIKKQQQPKVVHSFVVVDSKEGWADAFMFGLKTWYSGEDVEFDYSKLRPAGARLKTMGGRSSGPQPLIELMDFTRNMILKRQGSKLTTLQMHDLICKIGQIVVAGGVRRSALISLSDLGDPEMRDAKKGAFWNNNPQRCMSNNSAVYNTKPSMVEFMSEWLSLAESGTGERGIFNRSGLPNLLPERRIEILGEDIKHLGSNPCVTVDTWVQTVEGPQQVADLIGKSVDLIVNGSIYPMESNGFFLTGIKQIYEIKTAKGSTIKLTEDHPLLSNIGGINIWKSVSELQVNDRLLLSDHRNCSHWEGLGTYSEGWWLGEMVSGKRIPENLDDLKHFQKLSRKYGIYENIFTEKTEKTSSEFHKGLIKGLFNNLGEVVNLFDSCSVRIFYKTLPVLAAIKRMLLRLGIQSILFEQLNELVISDDNLILFDQSIGFYKKDKNYRLKEILRTTKLSRETFLDTIQSITKLDIQHVYDVTVSSVHEFCGNGFRAHNCSEIILSPMEFCNLSEVICRPDDDLDSLMRKARIATIIGTYQATLTNYKYISPKWKENQEKERLLGVSLTGQWDCQAVREEETLKKLKQYCLDINFEYSHRFKINRSASITAIKPSGTVSQLVNASSGIHPRFSKYYIRRIRISVTDPLLKLMRDQGYPCHPENGQDEETANTFVLQFPVKSPENAICTKDMTALEQLEYWKKVKINYTEHNPSVTIFVKEDEWLLVAQWVYSNFDFITGLSFLPYSDHIYEQAPYEEITEEKYHQLAKQISPVDFSKLIYYEKVDNTDVKKEVACAGGVCEL